jgi:MFS family permease
VSSSRSAVRPSTWDQKLLAEAIRHMAIIGIAGLIAGVLIGGVGGRVFMRLSAVIAPDRAGAITENGAVVGEITVGGTIAFILFIGIFAGGFGAVIYTISEPWLAWAGPMQGLVFGAFLLATGSVAVFDPGNPDFRILDNDPRNVIMLIVLHLSFGVVLFAVLPGLARRLPTVDEQRPIDSIPGYIAMVMGGILLLLLVLANLFFAGICECDPPRLMGLFVIGMVLSTAAYRVAQVARPDDHTSRSILMVGYLSTIGAFVTGSIRAVSDIAELL